MKNSEIFNRLLDGVCDICEISRKSIVNGSKLQSVVDARMLCIQYLRRLGLSCDDIALLVLREIKGDYNYYPPLSEIKIKAKGINRSFNLYSSRCLESDTFRSHSIDVNKFVKGLRKEMLEEPTDS